ncbi:GlmU family protein [Haliscomenobacter hydrossis]|uniref:Sugar phosphate nucleotidyl transferase n=1 Tax=Haliscomenobacter hydrossis (strain ATCC 27775 / DSM 1100 / LMG 10767 / O) TaxID=760192 RepID=F4KWE2_HALH1|nr:GlmU family protein [Haliscomenobacter hydrossis]AEE50292.1 sugar phosphate nucleotidyl transferase [Haliscomenobacter hydrossis DSM 1100]
MWHVILFDSEVREQLLPLTFTRPVGDLRVGALTIREKWEKWLNAKVSFITQDYLASKFPIDYGDENIVINGSVMPSERLIRLIRQMEFNEAYLKGEELIVAKLDREQLEKLIHDEDIDQLHVYDIEDTPFLKIDHPWDIFMHNAAALEEDFQLLTQSRDSQPLSDSNRIIGDPTRIFLEEGAKVEGASLNTVDGPIYIGKNAEIMEGSLIRGGLALGESAQVKMGTRLYGSNSFGPWSRIGGEVVNSVVQGYTNKAHDGFLGHSVIGEWCNIGADTNTSNLKNTYEEVRIWNYPAGQFLPTGVQFCGVIMADHVKVGINSMLNTGTVIGVGANIFGAGFPRAYIPSFAWGGAAGFTTFQLDKAFETAEAMMQRRGKEFDISERLILLRAFEDTSKYRNWEK